MSQASATIQSIHSTLGVCSNALTTVTRRGATGACSQTRAIPPKSMTRISGKAGNLRSSSVHRRARAKPPNERGEEGSAIARLSRLALLKRAKQSTRTNIPRYFRALGPLRLMREDRDALASQIMIRPWAKRDRDAVQGLLSLLAPEARVVAGDAPTHVAELTVRWWGWSLRVFSPR